MSEILSYQRFTQKLTGRTSGTCGESKQKLLPFSIAFSTIISILLAVTRQFFFAVSSVFSHICSSKFSPASVASHFFIFIHLHSKKVLFLRSVQQKFRDVASSALLGRLFSYSLPRFSDKNSGAVLILLAFFIPAILAGIEYTQELFKRRYTVLIETTISTNNPEKRCAEEAALAVARNWNPGLSLVQQKEAVYKIADAVYNPSPVLTAMGNPISLAIPGYQDSQFSITYEPMPGVTLEVNYTNSTKYRVTCTNTYATGIDSKWNPHFMLWLAVDNLSNPANRHTQFDEVNSANNKYLLIHHDICTNPFVGCTKVSPGYPDRYTYNYANSASNFYYSSPSTSSSATTEYNYNYSVGSKTVGTDSSPDSSATYSVRANSDQEHVKILIKEDSKNLGAIGVKTDKQTAYAIPASCNVDVVLAIPTNAAACNEHNRDTSSSGASGELPYSHEAVTATPSDVANTPIYQMAQACRSFVKNHFYHIRGVYMGLIPYSGKLSIPPRRADTWTTKFPSYTVSNQNHILGACLYGTVGVSSEPLSSEYSTYWGNELFGYPIMFRRGPENQKAEYGAGNVYYSGDLWNKTNPSTDEGGAGKYLCMNFNPTIPSAIDLPSAKCLVNCTGFCPNPYYMIEPTDDLVKIYEMCNALYPLGDPSNVSNFIFPVFEWANNFFQSWTNDPGRSEISGSDVDTSAILGTPSKTTAGRKKAIILLVNKPDHFEPQEMTYIGFNDDNVDVLQSNNGDVDILDFSKNSTISTQRHIELQSSAAKYDSEAGYFVNNNANGTCTLKVSSKKQVKLTVKPHFVLSFKEISCDLAQQIRNSTSWYSNGQLGVGPIEEGGVDKLVISNLDGTIAYSDGLDPSDNTLHWKLVRFQLDPTFICETVETPCEIGSVTYSQIAKDFNGNFYGCFPANNDNNALISGGFSEERYTLKKNYSFTANEIAFSNVSALLDGDNKVVTYSYDGTTWKTSTVSSVERTYVDTSTSGWGGGTGSWGSGGQQNTTDQSTDQSETVPYSKYITDDDGNVLAYYESSGWIGGSWKDKDGNSLTKKSRHTFSINDTLYKNVECFLRDNHVVFYKYSNKYYEIVSEETDAYKMFGDACLIDLDITSTTSKIDYAVTSDGTWAGVTSTNSFKFTHSASSHSQNNYTFSQTIVCNETYGSFDGHNYYNLSSYQNMSKYYSGMRYGNNTWVRLRYNDTSIPVEISKDYCRTWTPITTPYSALATDNALSFGNGVFMAVGKSNSTTYISEDGATWQRMGTGTGDIVKGLVYGQEKWIAVYRDGVTYSSTNNGVAWTKTSETMRHLHGCSRPSYATYGYGMFYAKYHSGNMCYSSNGISWYDATSSSSVNAENVTYYNGRMYCVGSTGGVAWVSEAIDGLGIKIKFTNLKTNSSSLENDKEYDVVDQTTFTINAEQIPDSLQITFEISKMALVSATIFLDTGTKSGAGNVVLKNYTGSDGSDSSLDAKNVTKDFYAKLVEEHGNNLRTYMIKYRTQENGGDSGSGSEEGAAEGSGETGSSEGESDVNNSGNSDPFAYLNDCAYSIKSASNQTELTEVLNEIAEDIKDWAGYEEAKVVE